MIPQSWIGDEAEAVIRREVVDKYGEPAPGVGGAVNRKSGQERVPALA